MMTKKTGGEIVLKSEMPDFEGQGRIPVVPINYDMYLPFSFGKYNPIGNEVEILETIIATSKNPKPFLIEGEKGIGKTMLVHELCTKHKIPLITVHCSAGTTHGDLVGRAQLVGDNSAFELGSLPKAICLANHFGRAVLYLDEENTLEPEIQKLLNPLLDDRRMITANDIVFRVNDGCQLIIIATMNPVHYSGTSPLNEELRSRHIGMEMKYPKPKQLEKVVDWKSLPAEKVKQILQLAADTVSLKTKNSIDYILSIRDIVMFVDTYEMWKDAGFKQPLEQAIETAILIKYEDAKQRRFMVDRCNETFAVKIAY